MTHLKTMDDRTEEQQKIEGGHSIMLTSPSGRIRLHPPNARYDDQLAQLRSHPESRRYITFWPKICTVDFVRARREHRATDSTIVDFYIFLYDKDATVLPTFIGITGIFNIDPLNDACSVGILVNPDYFRGGFATQALYTLLKYAFEDESKRMYRATFETAESNVNMRGWLENVIGAQPEFRWREAWKVVDDPEQRVDVMGYSILRHEWDAAKKRMESKMANRQKLQ